MADLRPATRLADSAIRDPPYGVSIVIAARNEGGAPAGAHRQPPVPRLPRRAPTDHRGLRRLDRRHAGGPRALPRRGSSTSSPCPPAARRWRSTPASSARGSRSSSSPTRGRCSRPTRCASWSRRLPIRRSAASPASCCSTAESACRRSDRDRRDFERRAGRRADAVRSPRRTSAGRRCARRSRDGVGLYWKYEKQLRRLESRIWLDARRHRRDLRHPPRALPAAAGRHDSRRRADADAGRAGAATASSSTRRRWRSIAPRPTRTPKRAARCARSPATTRSSRWSRRCCCRWRNPVWLQYVSHKVGRLVVPYALLAALASSIVARELASVLRRGARGPGALLPARRRGRAARIRRTRHGCQRRRSPPVGRARPAEREIA